MAKARNNGSAIFLMRALADRVKHQAHQQHDDQQPDIERADQLGERIERRHALGRDQPGDDRRDRQGREDDDPADQLHGRGLNAAQDADHGQRQIADRRQCAAEQDAEQQNLQDLLLSHGRHDVGRDEVEEEIHPVDGRHRRGRRVALYGEVDTDPGMEDRVHQQTDQQAGSGRHVEPHEGDADHLAEQADLLPHPVDAQHDRGEHQRNNQHPQRIDEGAADRKHLLAEGGPQEAERTTDEQAHQHLYGQRQSHDPPPRQGGRDRSVGYHRAPSAPHAAVPMRSRVLSHLCARSTTTSISSRLL